MGTIIYMNNGPNSGENTKSTPQQPSKELEFVPDVGNNDTSTETGPVSPVGEQPNLLVPNPQVEWPAFDPYSPDESGNAGTWSSIITMFPKPIIPCYFCNSDQVGLVRFLNAAANYPPFMVYINDQLAVEGLDNGDMSQYGRVSAETQTIRVTDDNNYEYIKKQIQVPANGAITVAIINTDTGLDIMVIDDYLCNGGINTGCFRVCNLSITNRKINVLLNGGNIIFRDVNYMQVTNFQYATNAYYMVSVTSSSIYNGNIILTSNIYIRGNVSYTMYVFNWSLEQNAIRILIVEDRRS